MCYYVHTSHKPTHTREPVSNIDRSVVSPFSHEADNMPDSRALSAGMSTHEKEQREHARRESQPVRGTHRIMSVTVLRHTYVRRHLNLTCQSHLTPVFSFPQQSPDRRKPEHVFFMLRLEPVDLAPRRSSSRGCSGNIYHVAQGSAWCVVHSVTPSLNIPISP